MINEDFKKWALGFSGCDGGDIGSPQHQSIWLCGLEWGGGFKPEQLADEFKNNVGKPPTGYESHKLNLDYQFNTKAVKLLISHSHGLHRSSFLYGQYSVPPCLPIC